MPYNDFNYEYGHVKSKYMVSNDDVCVCTLMKDDDHDDDMQLYCFYIYWAIYFLLFTFYLGDALYYYHHHHHHQKALRNKSQTSHGQRPGLKRNKSKEKILTIN